MTGMAEGIGNMAGSAYDKRMGQANQTGSFGNKGGFQKFMGMDGSQAPQNGQQQMPQQGMDSQFQSLMQMLMGGQQPRGRG
jgi:hypothetical protein